LKRGLSPNFSFFDKCLSRLSILGNNLNGDSQSVGKILSQQGSLGLELKRFPSFIALPSKIVDMLGVLV
jgi:hypothetical protein